MSRYTIIISTYFLNLQPTVCYADIEDKGLHSCPDDTRIYTEFDGNTCGIKVILSEPDDMGIWTVKIISLEDGQLSVVVSLC